MKPKVIIITGPTASGKTSLSIELAKKMNGEIICVDSMQVYKKMNIGTAKPTKEEMDGIKHYMLDVIEPDEDFNVVKYKILAEECIEEILKKGKTPILVGGTGLYVESLIKNIKFSDSNIDNKYRDELTKMAEKKGNEYIYNMLKQIDPISCQRIHLNDTKRIIRALEVYNQTGKTITEHNEESLQELKYNYLLFGIDMDREILYDRINRRVDIMLEDGLIDEVKDIYNTYKCFPTAMQGLGYKEVVEYLENKVTYDEMIEKLKMETRRYAKRQLTWFRRYKQMIWLNSNDLNVEQMLDVILDEYNK